MVYQYYYWKCKLIFSFLSLIYNMAYNAVIQLPALFDVDGGSAALFGEQQVVDVMNSHLIFTLDRQTQLGNGKVGHRAPASDADLQSLIEAFNDTFLVGDTSSVNNDSDSSNAEHAVLGSGLLTDLGAVTAADGAHPPADSNIATGTFPGIKVKFDAANAPYTAGENFLSDEHNGSSSTELDQTTATDGHYYYDDSVGKTKGGAVVTLHYVSGSLNEIQVTSGGNGYVVGDKVTILIPGSIISGGAAELKITLTADSINSEAGQMKFYVNMLGNKSGAYLAKYSEGTGQVAGPNDIVDDFCNKFADTLIKSHNSGYVNIPHPEKAIPMGGRTTVDGKAPLYDSSISPEAAEKCSLGTTMARAAAVHLVGHPLAQSLFSNEDGIVNELSTLVQEAHSSDFVSGDWDSTQEGSVANYGDAGYGAAVGGLDGRVGKQGFRFKSKLAKILSKLLGGSQADTRKFTVAAVDEGEDNSLKAGNGNAQVYKQMKIVRASADAAYVQTAVDVTAPACVQFGVKDDIEATAGDFTNGLRVYGEDGVSYHEHKGGVTALSSADQTGVLKASFGTGLTAVHASSLADMSVSRDGVALTTNGVAETDKGAIAPTGALFNVTFTRSAVADNYSVSVSAVKVTTAGSLFKSGDVVTIKTLNDVTVSVTLTGDNLEPSQLGNISPSKIADDHVNGSAMAAYNFIGVPKANGVHNPVLQAIYEQCMNVPGRATELDSGRSAVVTALPSSSLKAGAMTSLALTDGEVYGADGDVVVAAANIVIQKQFTSGASLTGAAITVTVASKKVTAVAVSTAGGSNFHVGDVLYISATALAQGTGDIEITLTSDNLTAADETGAHDKPYANNVMLTRNLASTNCIPTGFPMKAGDKLVCYLRPSLLLKFDQTLIQGSVNVQYIKADGSLETLDVNGIVNANANGEQGTIAATFPGMAFDANDDGETVQEWEDKAIGNTLANFVGKKVLNNTHAQSKKFCWMGSSVNARSDASSAADTALDAVAAVPAHTLQARQDAVTKPVSVSQQLTDEVDQNKLDLHVWKVTMAL